MTTILSAALMTLRLLTATTPDTASALCAAQWEPGSDSHAACEVGLETWRCEAQGWCDGGPSVRAAMPLVDLVWAGQQEW